MSTSALDHQLLDAFWGRLVVGGIGHLEVNRLVGHIFVGPKAQSLVAKASPLSLHAVEPKPADLFDSFKWDTLRNLFYQYDPALMGRYTSADGLRYSLCKQDNLQCQVFNLFSLFVVQLAASEATQQAIDGSNLLSTLMQSEGLDIRGYKEHFYAVCLFYMEVFSE